MINNLLTLDFSLSHEATEILSEWLLAVGSAGIESQDRQEFAELITEETPDYQAEEYLAELPAEVHLKAYFNFRENAAAKLEIKAAKAPDFSYQCYENLPLDYLDLGFFVEELLRPQLKLIEENLGAKIDYLGESPVEEVDWAENWKQFFQAAEIGKRLFLRPVWRTDPTPEGRQLLLLEPGAAFGSGTHPTTLLCLETLDRLMPNYAADAKILDLGCGTGILGIAAHLLTGAPVELIDLDPYAVERARANCECNELELDCHVGELRDSRQSQYELIIANLITRLHEKLLPEYSEKLERDGRLLLSGILEEAKCDLLSLFENNGYELLEERTQGDWCSLLLRKVED
ncbi:MAG: 50S ribosomal protein L11 methyltransferase [Eubacteriales bacterium]|nr:50S ribosomal protein L11 methyltransferase [Eubacteriales bacterium]